MNKYPFLIIVLFALIACNNTSQPKEPETPKLINPYEKDNNNPAGNVSFDYTATRLDKSNHMIEIKASLVNDNNDTLYFITTSCNGEQYSLVFDTLKYRVEPLVECNAVVPIIKRIPPKGRFTFQAKLKTTALDEKIRLGFDLFKAERGTSFSERSFNEIHNRSVDLKNIIWTDERLIE